MHIDYNYNPLKNLPLLKSRIPSSRQSRSKMKTKYKKKRERARERERKGEKERERKREKNVLHISKIVVPNIITFLEFS